MTAPRSTAGPRQGRGGSIYDLGYRGYEGPRLGRRAAIGALLTHSAADGLRPRPQRALQDHADRPAGAGPPALAAGARHPRAHRHAGRAGRGRRGHLADPLLDALPASSRSLVFLFCAAQAPELFGRDQRLGRAAALLLARGRPRSTTPPARCLGLLALAAGARARAPARAAASAACWSPPTSSKA